MGRKRKSRQDLPERVYQKHGAYYLVTPESKWMRLGKSMGEAMREYANLVGEREKITTMGQVIDRYQAEVLPEKAESTIQIGTIALVRLKKVFGAMRPQEIRPMDIYRYIDIRAKKNGKGAANSEKSFFSSVFNAAILWGIADKNPCKEVKRVPQPGRDRYMTDEEFQELYLKASPKMQCIMDLAYVTGLRKGDILKIKLPDIHDGELHVVTQKTKRKMVFTVEGDLQEIIDRAKSLRGKILSPYLLCAHHGGQIKVSNFNDQWARLKTKANLYDELHFHDIRAKAATDADNLGLNAQRLLGHKARSTTEQYIKQRQSDKISPLKKSKQGEILDKSINIRQQ